MNIIPSKGVAMAQIGDHRSVIESRLGLSAIHNNDCEKVVYDTDPQLIIHYQDDSTVELVEIAYSGDDGSEVWLDGVQLSYRFLDDVVADLAAKGYKGTPSDIGHDFFAGFAIWSMGSLCARDLDPGAGEEDEREVVEGVSVAPYAYFID
ncbi:hypothetical protein ASPWEDRAFT_177466 [Aspergillus wentii DTO 134E9]|uniref:Uncharacterized protein n=1 Tax=Aspergillus wentii DTO 134E9 TaxID=1073089 RepID=A0A1L9R492_ASPWE|nr:uncharacterized protein ASPWEDRAFT_177466 [Aspergillus wentii DTO 134E9]KAI9927010.1 hypothetical protein MW887_003391 [Aspergillus wentii]OJJ29724.1 hypothetical protein ASPWEDRAFT_177466 [Aspergillus wentii DTO 134E9]